MVGGRKATIICIFHPEISQHYTRPVTPTMHPDGSSVEIQLRPHDLNTDITDSSCQPGPLPAVHCEQPRLLDHRHSAPMSADRGLQI